MSTCRREHEAEVWIGVGGDEPSKLGLPINERYARLLSAQLLRYSELCTLEKQAELNFREGAHGYAQAMQDKRAQYEAVTDLLENVLAFIAIRAPGPKVPT